jgi:hypothetical protein
MHTQYLFFEACSVIHTYIHAYIHKHIHTYTQSLFQAYFDPPAAVCHQVKLGDRREFLVALSASLLKYVCLSFFLSFFLCLSVYIRAFHVVIEVCLPECGWCMYACMWLMYVCVYNALSSFFTASGYMSVCLRTCLSICLCTSACLPVYVCVSFPYMHTHIRTYT